MTANPIEVFMDVIHGAPLNQRQTEFVMAIVALGGADAGAHA